MSVVIEWDNAEQTALRYDLSGRWTWEEFFAAFDQGRQMLSQVEHVVHFILNPLDDASRNYVPPGALTHSMNIHRRSPPNAGYTIFVGAGTFILTLQSIGMKIAPQSALRYRFCSTLDDAREILAELIKTKT
ncbi:MAG: hypothetical protein JNJ61_19550 [Anaerolineae bacterium]|nr:hypothetical protein [Anaerolineae bacterium]